MFKAEQKISYDSKTFLPPVSDRVILQQFYSVLDISSCTPMLPERVVILWWTFRECCAFS